jgi:plasmid replication initiation protein
VFISEIVHTEDSFLLKLYYKFNFATEPFTFDAEKRIHSKRQPKMANVAQPKQYISREKTPKWLHERNQSNTTRKMTEEEKALLKEQQQAFRQQLELDWED